MKISKDNIQTRKKWGVCQIWKVVCSIGIIDKIKEIY